MDGLPEIVERTCRVCGCTDLEPCIDETGWPCSWIASDLCSECVPRSCEVLLYGPNGEALVTRSAG